VGIEADLKAAQVRCLRALSPQMVFPRGVLPAILIGQSLHEDIPLKAFFGKLGTFLTALRVWSVNIFTLLLLVWLVGVIAVMVGKMPSKVDPEGKVLIISPEGLVLDQEVYPSEFNFPFSMPDEEQIQSRDLIKLIRAAAADEGLTGVLIDFSKAAFSGPSTALNIAIELEALRESGKPVISYGETLSTSGYLMASRADEIFVHPSGALSISGLGGYRNYTREMTDKLKITLHNYSQGDFKSAVEGVTRNDMSEPDKLQRRELYNPIWASIKASMAAARGLDPELFQELADQHTLPLIAEAGYDGLAFAQERGVIDGTKDFPEFRAYMIGRFGKAEDDERETYPHISAEQYFAQLEEEEQPADDAVAVVFVEGGIQPGKLGPGVAGSDDVARLIRKAYEDEDTKALVLRVNSPGGSIIASDIIRGELQAARNRGLPVLVSMGDVAASGGVWVSMPAEHIYAEPTTITGSIGVAVAFPTMENLFDYIGVHFDGVTTSAHAGWSPVQGVNAHLDAIFASWAGSAYTHFINTVASSRDKDPGFIRSIAGGRVWLAPAALELGLIDEIGTMEDTIADAAQRAGLEQFRINYVVKEVSPAVALLRRFSAGLAGEVSSPVGSFAQKISHLLLALENISQPRALVMCTICTFEMP
jgi:protease IV